MLQKRHLRKKCVSYTIAKMCYDIFKGMVLPHNTQGLHR